MTFLSHLRSLLLACVLLAVTAGCESIPESQSWFAPNHVAQNAGVPQTPQPPAAPGALPAAPQPAYPVLPPNVKIRAAILLPLSGQYAQLGQAMLNAAQLAVFDASDNHFELMPRDTAGSPDGSERATQDAVASGAQIIIGPVFAPDVNRVKPMALHGGLNMLALSTDTALADQNVFVMGFAPAPQVDRVMTFAHNHGVHNFAALIPKGAYGDLVNIAFQTALTRNGDRLVDTQSFDGDDYQTAIAALAAEKDQIEALFLPVGGENLAKIAKQLAAAGFLPGRPRLIGTGLWDVPDIGNSGLLAGGWYAASDPRARRNFLSSYSKTYGGEAPRLSTLAYDATALTALLAKQGGRYDRAALTNPNGFAGIDGIFRLTSGGLVERGLAVLEVGSNGGRVVDPAPVSFAGAGH